MSKEKTIHLVKGAVGTISGKHLRMGGPETEKVTFCDAAKKEIAKIVADAIRKAK
jgi:hypothetical protein